METSKQYAEAVRNRDLARQVMDSKPFGSKAWRDAEDDLNFWQGRVAMTPPAR